MNCSNGSQAAKRPRAPSTSRSAELGQWKSCAADPYGVLDCVVGGFRHQVVRPHAGKSRLDRGGGSAGRQNEAMMDKRRAARAGDRSRRMSPVPSLSSPHMAADCSVGCGGGSKRSSNTAESHRPPSLASTFHEWQRIARCNAPWPRPARSGGRGQSDPLRPVRRCFLGREVAVDEF